ncbi:MAG TPA: hypothetical protein VK192_06665 [Sphingomicrobium sp.]|nr:hypothetical protein [Sphingomicrobium sp.]
MKDSLILCSTNRGVFQQTRKLINSLKDKGALYMEQSGTSCVALARNLALTTACQALDEAPCAKTLVMLDDDMDAQAAVVQELVAMSRKLKQACSATYTTATGTISHSPAPQLGKGLWFAGLGMIAIPRAAILRVRDESPTFKVGTRIGVRAFTEARMIDGEWSSEDYTLSRRLGGVVLLPIAAGHLKVQSLQPNHLQLDTVAKSFAEFANGRL